MRVDELRVNPLNVTPTRPGRLVLYWMSRDQRVEDNWALLYAASRARELKAGLAVAFCLDPQDRRAASRIVAFLLAGLAETAAALERLGIPFVLLHGEPVTELTRFVTTSKTRELVCDFDPLRHKTHWRRTLAARLDIPVVEVDAHNIVPARWMSVRREVGAWTLRPKIERALPGFLTPFPTLTRQGRASERVARACVASAGMAAGFEMQRPDVATGDEPGTAAGRARLQHFLASGLARYGRSSNDPHTVACSRLSAYLHFGQISAQRVAWEASQAPAGGGRDAFLDHLIVRRELADNFCLFEPAYDAYAAAPAWARATLELHRLDRREYRYDGDAFEHARTHDELWNTAQRGLVTRGELHDGLRMYWAKKILEWSDSPETALHTALRLNDRYALDGRDPNGYANIACAVLGVHDRPGPERPVYGMVRVASC